MSNRGSLALVVEFISLAAVASDGFLSIAHIANPDAFAAAVITVDPSAAFAVPTDLTAVAQAKSTSPAAGAIAVLTLLIMY
jgi:hypothetical protein